jgi:beta-lactamase regulating signal transducer with metallopeptidase domain/tetratricopeptide (TPR) repeat protein
MALLPWPALISLAGVAVAAFLWLVLLIAIAAAALLAARSAEVCDPALRAELTRARTRLGVRAPVSFRSRPGLRVPVVAGVIHPALLVPAEAVAWPRDRVRAVLLHELAHVRRRDGWSLLLARAATAACWFHPLAWLLARVARRECERACDDLVLETGMRPSDYAEHLLWVARASHRGSHAFALAFARPSSLEGRLLAILRSDARRGVNSRRALAFACAAAIVALVPLASLRVVAAPAERADATEPATDARRRLDRGGSAERQGILGLPSIDGSWELDAGADAARDPGPGSAPAGNPDPDCKASPAGDAARRDSGPAAPALRDPDPDPNLDSSAPAVPADFDGRIDRLGLRTGGGWFDRGRSLYHDRRYAESAEAYLRAAGAGHRPGTSLYNAACSYALDGQTEPALVALEAAIAAGFDGVGLLARDDDLDALRAEERFERLLATVRRTPAAERDRRAASAEYEALRASGTRDADAWRSAGLTLLRAGEYGQSARAFEKQIAIEPGANAYYNLACALGLGGDETRGLEALEQAVLAGYSDPDHMLSDADLRPLRDQPQFDELVELANDLQLFSKGRHDDDRASWRRALPDFERVTRRHPKVGRAWFNLGYARLKAGEAEASYQAFGRALELAYRVPTTTYNLGCASAQMGEVEEALRWLDRAEAEGMDLAGMARGDRDLDPLRSDRGFRERLDRWEREKRSRWREDVTAKVKQATKSMQKTRD